MSYALITGSAKGIGSAIAEEMAGRGYHLLLVDIDASGLQQTKERITGRFNLTVHTLPLDLTLPDAISRLKEWTLPYHTEMNVVISNAGYGLNAAFEKLPITEHENIVDLNVKAQMKIAHTYLPVLRQFPKSYLLIVGSTTCYQSIPYLSVYAASKAFVISFARSLRYELKNSPVSVSCLIPGSTDTDFVNRARMGEKVKKTASRYNMTAAAVGKIAVKGLFAGKAEIIPGFSNKLHAFFPKFFPKIFVERIAAKIYRP